jgi:hypothetical protein
MEPRSKSKALEAAEEEEAEDEIKPPAKGEVEDSPKLPTQQDPLASSWEDLADKEDALGLMQSQSID